MNAAKATTDETTIKAALRLLRRGEATLSEVADLAGRSRQIVRHWAKRSAIDATVTRSEYLKKKWAKLTAK